MSQALPDLPPRLKVAVLAAAENLTALAHSEGLELGGPRGEARPHLLTMLYLLRERCVAAELEPLLWLGDQMIMPAEIATVLETIAQLMVSDGLEELAGHNASWFSDAALVVERLAQGVDQ